MDNRTAWDGWHVMGNCIGTAYLNHAGLEWYQSALVVLTFGVVWELADQIARNNGGDSAIFDIQRGFDSCDIFRDAIGINLSFPIRRKQ